MIEVKEWTTWEAHEQGKPKVKALVTIEKDGLSFLLDEVEAETLMRHLSATMVNISLKHGDVQTMNRHASDIMVRLGYMNGLAIQLIEKCIEVVESMPHDEEIKMASNMCRSAAWVAINGGDMAKAVDFVQKGLALAPNPFTKKSLLYALVCCCARDAGFYEPAQWRKMFTRYMECDADGIGDALANFLMPLGDNEDG